MEKPECVLEYRKIKATDGWCDAPEHESYNRLVGLPFSASHEKLWRDDYVYDLIVEIGHNDAPPVPGLGSAVFMHIVREGYEPTEGCVALAKADLLVFLTAIQVDDTLVIQSS